MTPSPRTAPATLAGLGPDEGYAFVALLYDAGALCCMDYEALDIHSECVWHHPAKAEALLAAWAERIS